MNPSPQTLLEQYDPVGILELVEGRTYYLLRMDRVVKVRYDGSDDRYVHAGVGQLCFSYLPENPIPGVRSTDKMRVDRRTYRARYQAFETEPKLSPKRSRVVTQLHTE